MGESEGPHIPRDPRTAGMEAAARAARAIPTSSIASTIQAIEAAAALQRQWSGLGINQTTLDAIAKMQGPVGLLAIDRSIQESAKVWRTQLSQTQDWVRSATLVGQSVSAAIAARQTYASDALAALRTAGIDTTLGVKRAAQALSQLRREVAEPYQLLARQAVLTHKALGEALRGAGVAAAIDWARRARRFDAQQKLAVAALRNDGWEVAPSWPVSRPGRLVALRRAQGKRALDRAVCQIYSAERHRGLRSMVDSWMEDPAYRARRPIIREGLALHREGRYRASIATLLPHVEGIAVDVFAPGSKIVNPLKLYKAGVDPSRLERLVADGLLGTLGVLYQPTSFETVNPRARTLNRHLILHGRTVNYGSEANSIKVFLAFDQLASEARAKRDYDVARIPA